MSITYRELVADVTSRLDGKVKKKDVEAVLTAFGDAAATHLFFGHVVYIPKVGRLKTVERSTRKGRNPRTGEEITIPARRNAVFVATKQLKATLAGATATTEATE